MNFELPINNQNQNENTKDAESIEKIDKNEKEVNNNDDNKENKNQESLKVTELKERDQEESQEKIDEIRESLGIKESRELENVEGFDKAYDIIENEVDSILKEKEKALISVAGKSGSGKTFFSEELRDRLLEKGKSTILISSDNFYKEHKGIEDKELDIDKMQDEIQKKQKEFDIVVVEGLQLKDNNVLGQEPDFKTIINSNFEERLATKIDRDSKTFRSIEDSLDLVVETFAKNSDIAKKFEGDIDMNDVDLEVENNYKNLNEADLYIQNNELIFSSSEGIKKRKLSDEEFKVLEKAGIKSLN